MSSMLFLLAVSYGLTQCISMIFPLSSPIDGIVAVTPDNELIAGVSYHKQLMLARSGSQM